MLLLVLVLASAGAATNVFASVLASDRLSYLDTAILGIFFLSFAWISSAFWTALAGFVALCRGGGAGLRTPGRPPGRGQRLRRPPGRTSRPSVRR